MKTLLWIDNDEKLIDRSAPVFKRYGFELVKATSVSSALVILSRQASGLNGILLDIQLGGGENGLDILPVVRDLYPGLRVVVFTAHADYSDELNAQLDGASAFFDKVKKSIPLAPDKLASFFAALHRLFPARNSSPTIKTTASPTSQGGVSQTSTPLQTSTTTPSPDTYTQKILNELQSVKDLWKRNRSHFVQVAAVVVLGCALWAAWQIFIAGPKSELSTSGKAIGIPSDIRTELSAVLGQFASQIDPAVDHPEWRNLPPKRLSDDDDLRKISERWKVLSNSIQFKWPQELTNEVFCFDLAIKASFDRFSVQSDTDTSQFTWKRRIEQSRQLIAQVQMATKAGTNSGPLRAALFNLDRLPDEESTLGMSQIAIANALAARQAFRTARDGFRDKLNR